jgi:hypothetical protein
MKYQSDPILKAIQNELITHAKCHTLILYGSRARGDETATSDYDILAICKEGEFKRDCRYFEGFYLDIFIYPEEQLKIPCASLLRIKDGKVLCQKNEMGDALLKQVQDMFSQGPPVTPDWEKHEISMWILKMLARAKQDDIEANFRMHWLLHDLLECYFKLRDHWYLGPKESFQWLKANDINTFFAFEKALKPGTSLQSISDLVKQVSISIE